MNTQEFNKVVDKIIKDVKNILVKKQEEYNLDDDRLNFFKKACLLMDNMPHQALLGYVNKQIVSEFEMGFKNNEQFTEERWLEKILDIISYQILLYAVLSDTDMFKKEEK